MVINTGSLIAAIDAISLVPSRSGILPSEFFKLEKRGPKLYFSLAAEVYGRTFAKGAVEMKEKDWVFFVDRNALTPFVTAPTVGPRRAFKFSIVGEGDKKRMVVVHGKRKATFQSITEVKGYATFSGKGKLLTLTPEHRAMLYIASRYATADPTLAHLNCVYMVKKKYALASNQSVIFRAADKVIPQTIPFPLMVSGMFGSDKVNAITITPDVVKLEMTNGYLCQTISTAASKDFPHKKILSEFSKSDDFKSSFELRGRTFFRAIARMGSYLSGTVNRDMVVVIEGNKGDKILVLEGTAPSGKFREVVRLAVPLAQDIKIEWLLESLLPLAEREADIDVASVKVSYDKDTPYRVSTTAGIDLLLSRRI
jgi:hypothetical protein